MATPRLIGAYLDALEARLPADIVAELADGLAETYAHHLDRGLTPDAVAEAAIADFGSTDQVTTAFARTAPGRRLARALLATGPLVGACWATALLATGAWQTLSTVARTAGPAALLVIIALLAAAWRGPYRRIRPAMLAAGAGLVVLDAAALTAAALLAPTLAGPWLLAAAASAGRLALTLRALPHVRAAA